MRCAIALTASPLFPSRPKDTPMSRSVMIASLLALAGTACTAHGQVIFNNGGFVTAPAAGFGGADVSEVQPTFTSAGSTIAAATFLCGDDFVVPNGSKWDAASVSWFAYQTQTDGVPNTTSTFTSAVVQIYDGNPLKGGRLVAGDTTTNRLIASNFANAYRIFNAAPLANSQRAIFENVIDLSWAADLEAGRYWVVVGLTGSVASGPFAVPVTPNRPATDNAVQFNVAANAWVPVSGNGGAANGQSDFPFKVAGSVLASTASTNPHGEGSVSPEVTGANGTLLFTVPVTPGSNPASTGLTVTADLTAINLANNVALNDAGTNGDVTAGDGIYSVAVTVPASASFGPKVSQYTIADAQNRSYQLNFLYSISDLEPNDTKAQATPVTIAPGDTIAGQTTGTSTTVPGPASADYYRVRTAAAPAGIYRHRLVVTSPTAGHTSTIRGLTQSARVINPTTDATFQTASTTSTPPRFVQWYGFGRQEEIFYRVTGVATTTGAYTATAEREAVTPVVVAGTVIEGNVTFGRATGNTTAVDMWLYDANLNPIADAGNQGNNTLTRSLTPGRYFLAISNANTANNLPHPADDTATAGIVLDFPDAIANSSTVSVSNLGMALTHSGGTTIVAGSKAALFDVVFYQFDVSPATTPIPPSGVGLFTPAASIEGIGGSTLLVVDTSPGLVPPSTTIAVTADLSSLGGSAAQTLFDDGSNGDLVAGDGNFSFTVNIAPTLTAGARSIPFTVSDQEPRSTTGSATFTVRPVTNLGTITSAATVTNTERSITTANEVIWYRFTINGPVADPGNFLDISLAGSTTVDLEIAIFDSAGNFIATDDDGGPGLLSQLSFGNVGPRTADPTGEAFAGQDGALTAGEYYLAVCSFNATFATPFTVNTPGANLAPVVSVRLVTDLPAGPAGCNVADIVSIGGNPPADGLLTGDDFNAFIGAFAANSLLADIVSIGGLPPGDGLVTGDDFNAFIAAFAAGCP